MTKQTDQPSDRPQILLDASDLFGRKTTQKVSPDVNRQSPYDEFSLGWAELLRLPDTVCDLLLQIGVWFGYGAFTTTAIALLEFPAVLTYPIALVSGGFLLTGAIAAQRNQLNAFPFFYRLALIASGIAVVALRFEP
jgi:hypothetical protein